MHLEVETVQISKEKKKEKRKRKRRKKNKKKKERNLDRNFDLDRYGSYLLSFLVILYL